MEKTAQEVRASHPPKAAELFALAKNEPYANGEQR